ncbi:MAG: radical SAM family heme chaperone HemW [Nitrospira sp.]|nr:radical SAM family heme chaperone HemW [Nitrospira sp.]
MTAVADFKNALGRIHVEDLGLYAHVPFCRERCRFCAFYMERPREKRVQTFLDGLEQELCLYARDVGLRKIPVHTIYFGGGTPTTLPSQDLIGILHAIRRWFLVEDDAEVSVEVHPGTVTAEALRALRQAGFTRLSVGGQSFDQTELLELGGRSYGVGVRQVISWALAAGFTNISLDLMFGFPGQSMASWQRTLDEAIALSPPHLSCYAYTLEEGSPFYREVMRGKRAEPDQEFQVVLEERAVERLAAAGFERYEISNYCRPGYECRHNMRYWQVRSCLGLGPSAQSCLGDARFGNVANLEWYADSLKRGTLPLDEITCLSHDQVDRERVIWGLRMLSGVRLNPTENRQRPGLRQTIRQLGEEGLLQVEEQGRVTLTDLGLRYADTVAVALL